MDAGVPIKDMVAGISIGLVTNDKDYRLLTDIMGLEDHFGDMDFKVAGTEKGVTAIQLDLKIQGVDVDVLIEGLKQAKSARSIILEKMRAVIDKLLGFMPQRFWFLDLLRRSHAERMARENERQIAEKAKTSAPSPAMKR